MSDAENYMAEYAEFIAQTGPSELPKEILNKGARVLLDVLGANIRGSEEPENRALGDYIVATESGNSSATLLRAGFERVGVLGAAFANGTQAATTEVDEGFRHASAHGGTYVMSGALALAEDLDSSGPDLLTAFVLGYETAARAAVATAPPKFRIQGHGVFASLGTAAAAAKLTCMTAGKVREALAISSAFAHAAPYHAHVKGATVRNLWNGIGARNGILSVFSTEWGFVGLPDAMHDSFSLLVPNEFARHKMVAGLGDSYCIAQNYHKQYACCGNFDASIEAALGLLSEATFSPDDIEHVSVYIYAPYHTLNDPRPRNALAAKFSLRYSVATALVHGHAHHEAFSGNALIRPDLLALSDRTELIEDKALAVDLPVRRPARVAVRLRDGRQFTREVGNPRGHYLNPFTDEELDDKFARLAGRYLGQKGSATVREIVLGFVNGGSSKDLSQALNDYGVKP